MSCIPKNYEVAISIAKLGLLLAKLKKLIMNRVAAFNIENPKVATHSRMRIPQPLLYFARD